MVPAIYPNDCTLFEPVIEPRDLREGDIVFAEVQPKKWCYSHYIQKIDYWSRDETRRVKGPWVQGAVPCFHISNAAGTSVGWCFSRHIHGRLIEVRYTAA